MNHGTIVIPAYNEEKRIQETIERAKNQSTKYGYNIIVVDNGSTDKTRDIAHKSGVDIIDEKIKGVKYARLKGVEAAKDLYNSRIILQLDADTHVGENWVQEHVKQYEDENIGIVGGSLEWTERSLMTASVINITDLFKGRLLSLTDMKFKNHFEKRISWLEQGVLPIPGTNMSYLSELGSDSTTLIGGESSLGEDYYKATKIFVNHLIKNPSAEFKLLDNKNIVVRTPSRGDHTLINFLKQKSKYKKSKTSHQIKTGDYSDFEDYQMNDYR